MPNVMYKDGRDRGVPLLLQRYGGEQVGNACDSTCASMKDARFDPTLSESRRHARRRHPDRTRQRRPVQYLPAKIMPRPKGSTDGSDIRHIVS